MTPTEVKFSVYAEKEFITYWEELQRRKATVRGMESQMLAKLQIYIEKIAGLIELLKNDGKVTEEISKEAMEIAISYTRAFGQWAMKTYSFLLPPSDLKLTKNLTLKNLIINYPGMNKNLVAQGLGINRSLLSRT